MSGRDPRVTPEKYDLLQKGRASRGVEEVDTRQGKHPDDVWVYYNNGRMQPVGCHRPSCSLSAWRRWAAGAEVLRVAEKEEE